MENYDEKLEAVKRILKKLKISRDAFFMLLDEYNTRTKELNQRILKYSENFLLPHMRENEDGSFEYTLTEDDRNVLSGYKKQNDEILEKEFPELFEVMDDLRIFEDDNFKF